MITLRISAFSHKGGVGRTTVCYALFHRLMTLAIRLPDLLKRYGYERVVFIDWDKQVNLLRLAFRHNWDGSSSFKNTISGIEFEVLSGNIDSHTYKDDNRKTLIVDDCSPSIDLFQSKSFLKNSDKIICPVNGRLSMYGVQDIKYVLDQLGWEKKEIYLIPMNVPRSFYWQETYLREMEKLLTTDPELNNDLKNYNKDVFVFFENEFIYSDRNFSQSENLAISVFEVPYCRRSRNVRNMKIFCDVLLFDKKELQLLIDIWESKVIQ